MRRGAGLQNNCVISSGNGNEVVQRRPPPSHRPPPFLHGSPAPCSPPDVHPSPPASPKEDSLAILHFNDVYNIEGRDKEPVGGAARFKTCLDGFQHLDPITLFSGDALSPSNISVVMKGVQMVPVLNALNIQCAVYGNHDFDFGMEHLEGLAGEMTFPWLMSNVRSTKTGDFLASGKEYHIIEKGGRKIGLMGLVEWEWIVTLATLEPKDVEYTDFVATAKTLVAKLQDEGCDLLIALTHMRVPNDLHLAREVPELHMVLGGHDHHYEKQQVGDVLVLKSGSEFREFSLLLVQFPQDPTLRPQVHVERHTVRREVTPDPDMEAIVEKYLNKVQEGLEVKIGETGCCLEGRFKYVRTRETNLGNLVTDIMRRTMKADVALLNSGTLRSDCVHEPGLFKMKDLLAILPIVDSVMLLELTGEHILKALENGVSMYPRHEGRFPQVSGLTFTFDPSCPGGERVVRGSVRVGDSPLRDTQTYRLCTKGYIGKYGKDGYDVFRDCKQLVKEDEGPILFSMVRDYFESCSKCSEDVDFSEEVPPDKVMICPREEGRIVILSPHSSESSGSE